MTGKEGMRPFELLYDWPPADRYTYIGLGLSVLGVYISLKSLRVAAVQARDLQRDAIAKVEARIRKGLTAPSLLSANGLRALAYAIEKNTMCPVITDKILCEAVRRIALEIEDQYQPRALTRRLDQLNDLLNELNCEGIPLASIAYIDSVLAFRLAGATLAVTIFAVQLSLIKPKSGASSNDRLKKSLTRVVRAVS